ncbi:MAG: hypothetical protein E7399_09275 [Ruminococcaceae bacterium]|nr:hypothetical protein [Oscillospiraceae bacterium]
MNRITIMAGHFGSGKTEFALNYALHLKKTHENVTIVDMDTVNPYFRTKDAEERLNEAGVGVISPRFANTNVDILSVPPEILSVFENSSCAAVFDVGGDDEGAIVLGVYEKLIRESGYEMLFVMNPKRPFTETPEQALEMMTAIEQASRLKFTGIVNTANLMEETTPQLVAEGEQIVRKTAELSNLPFLCTVATAENLVLLSEPEKGFPIELFLKKPF